jgi:hypothetical protein
MINVKVQVFPRRPGQALWAPGDEIFTIFGYSALKGSKVVSLTYRPPFPPKEIS